MRKALVLYHSKISRQAWRIFNTWEASKYILDLRAELQEENWYDYDKIHQEQEEWYDIIRSNTTYIVDHHLGLTETQRQTRIFRLIHTLNTNRFIPACYFRFVQRVVNNDPQEDTEEPCILNAKNFQGNLHDYSAVWDLQYDREALTYDAKNQEPGNKTEKTLLYSSYGRIGDRKTHNLSSDENYQTIEQLHPLSRRSK